MPIPFYVAIVALISTLSYWARVEASRRYIWTGNHSTDWSDCANWALEPRPTNSACESVGPDAHPRRGDTAIFTGAAVRSAYLPKLEIEEGFELRHLIIDESFGRRITIGAESRLFIDQRCDPDEASVIDGGAGGGIAFEDGGRLTVVGGQMSWRSGSLQQSELSDAPTRSSIELRGSTLVAREHAELLAVNLVVTRNGAFMLQDLDSNLRVWGSNRIGIADGSLELHQTAETSTPARGGIAYAAGVWPAPTAGIILGDKGALWIRPGSGELAVEPRVISHAGGRITVGENATLSLGHARRGGSSVFLGADGELRLADNARLIAPGGTIDLSHAQLKRIPFTGDPAIERPTGFATIEANLRLRDGAQLSTKAFDDMPSRGGVGGLRIEGDLEIASNDTTLSFDIFARERLSTQVEVTGRIELQDLPRVRVTQHSADEQSHAYTLIRSTQPLLDLAHRGELFGVQQRHHFGVDPERSTDFNVFVRGDRG